MRLTGWWKRDGKCCFLLPIQGGGDRDPNAVTMQALIHTETELKSLPVISTTVSTMPDPLHDWSPIREEDSDSVSDTSLNFPASPKEQHTPLRCPHPCVRQEDDLICLEDPGECEQDKVCLQRVTLSPDKVTSLKTATQARLYIEPGASLGMQCDMQEDGPNRHLKSNRKKADWTLTVQRKWFIVGDSNLSILQEPRPTDRKLSGGQF